MWKIPNRKRVKHDWLDFEPSLIIDEYDGPVLFTSKDLQGNLFLCYLCQRTNGKIRFLVVSTCDQIVNNLLEGKINLRESLTNNSIWIFDLDNKWIPKDCWKVTVADLPRDLLPLPGVMLRPDMKSVAKNIMSTSVSSGSSVQFRLYNTHTHAGV